MNNLARVVVTVVAAVSQLSCDNQREVRLLDEDARASEERLRRMNITAEQADGNGGWTPLDDEVDIFTVTDWIAEHCKSTVASNPALDRCDGNPLDACSDYICGSQLALCGALKLRELASAIAPIGLDDALGAAAYRIPPQDAESRAGFEQAAVYLAANSIGYVDDALHGTATCTSARMSDAVGAQESDQSATLAQNVGELLSSTLVEALQVGEEAAIRGSDSVVGLADRDRTGIANRGRGARLSWFDRNLSRLIALQLQTGGVVVNAGAVDIPLETGPYLQDQYSPTHLSLAEVGIGSQPPCTGACAEALHYLRYSGAPLSAIVADPATTSLSDLIANEVSPRLSVRLNRSVSDPGAVFGFSDQALAEARSWMRQEAATFARPTGITAPIPALMPEPDGDPRTTMLTFDAATMADPERPPIMHYLTAARAGVIWEDDFKSLGIPLAASIPPLQRPERAYLFDWAHTLAREAIATDRLDSRADGILGTILQDAAARRAARCEVCSRTIPANKSHWRIRVFGAPEDQYALVEGTTNLRCAVDGEVEGQPCVLSLATTTSGPSTGTVTENGTTVYYTGWPDYVEWTTDHQGGTFNRPFWYVVRLRPGRDPGPGAYEAIGGIPWKLPTDPANQWDTCITLPFDGRSMLAADGMFASGYDLTPDRTCDGQDLNGPIPLEDEIIDDLDPYETSWRHHLQTATLTAQHADELAHQLLAAGLEMDLRSERALDEIAEACGVPINLDNLFNADGEAGQISLDDLIHVPMDPCAISGCPSSDYQCVGEVCVSSLMIPTGSTRFEQEALLRCLGYSTGLSEASNMSLVALGSQSLCVWYDADAPDIICRGATAGECPFPAPEDGVCGDPPVISGGPTQAMIRVDDALELFDHISPEAAIIGQIAATRLSDCDHIRSLRERAEPPRIDDRSFEIILRSSFFSYESVRYWADRIGWRGYPLDYSEFTLDGAPWAGDGYGGTGYPFINQGRAAGPASATDWPCGDEFPGTLNTICAGDDRSLFCSTVGTDCNNQSLRAAFNRRMGRAAATLGALSGIGLSQLWMPVHYRDWDVISGTAPGFVDLTDHTAGAHTWQVTTSMDFGEDNLRSGMIVVPSSLGDIVWRSQDDSGTDPHIGGSGADEVNFVHPFGFVNFGATFAAGEELAREIARRLWAGLTPGRLDSQGVPTSVEVTEFAHAIPIGSDVSCRTGFSFGECEFVEEMAVFRRAIYNAPETDDTAVFIEGRAHWGEVSSLTDLFRSPPYDVPSVNVTNIPANQAHLFEAPDGCNGCDGYGANITHRDLLDAMELMCEVANTVPPNSIPNCGEGPPPVYSMADIGIVQSHMRCVATRLDAMAQRQVVQNIPEDVYRDLRGEAGDERPEVGAYGELISELRRVLRAQAEAPRQIASQLRGAADDIELLKSHIRQLDRQKVIAWLTQLSTVVGTIATCASGNFGAACGTAVTQLMIGLAITDLQVDNAMDQERDAFTRFRQTMDARVSALAGLEEALNDGGDSVESVLARIRAVRMNAQSALARAAFADSDAAGRHYPVNTAMRRLYNINLYRYEEAQDAAVRAAIVARRAIEQRFGVDLTTQTCSSLVDPPSTWAGDMCNASGVDYAMLRDPTAPDPTRETARQMFIGDYVRRLEQWVESYRFDYPYSSGQDTIVLSVRDDLAHVRGPCTEPALNLLGASNDLQRDPLPRADGTDAPSGAALLGWHIRPGGCTGDASNCVIAQPLPPDTPGPGASGLYEANPPRAFRVTFWPATPSTCTLDAGWVQDLYLSPGVYRLSWYSANDSYEQSAIDVMPAGLPRSPRFAALASRGEEVLETGWERRFFFFRVDAAASGTPVQVGVFAIEDVSAPFAVDIAGIQLEDVTETVGTRSDWMNPMYADVHGDPTTFYPAPFVATTAPGFARYEACRTRDPASFVREWRYECQRLCSDGFSSDTCREGEVPQSYCYWQLGFQLTEAQLLGREGSLGGGFAFGNFNYRAGAVAVNVVGTGVLDCGGPDAPACYATASIPYSLEHAPLGHAGDPSAYTVRTHEGALHPVHLFPGRIESARALVAERYLTNPMSSADEALIGDYRRTELRGRPLPGSYILRIWDTPGLNFGAVEDIQIALDYRYFTRTADSTCSASSD